MGEELVKSAGSFLNTSEYYNVLNNYLIFCIQNPMKGLESLSDGGKNDKSENGMINAQQYEQIKKEAQLAYNKMCDEISKHGTDGLKAYADLLIRLLNDKPELKKEINSILVSARSLKLFREARQKITDLYPILIAMNVAFSVAEYPELSLAPKSSMYGSKIKKSSKETITKSPIGNDEYKAMLEVFLQLKDYKRFGDWLMAILVFTPHQIVNEYREEYTPVREELKDWAYKQINSNENYKRSIDYLLFKQGRFRAFADFFVEKPIFEEREKDFENKIKTLEDTNKKELERQENLRKNQFESIQKKNTIIKGLERKAEELDECLSQLHDLENKYKAQISINEKISLENDRRIEEMQDEYDSRLEGIQDEYERVQKELSNSLTKLEEHNTSYDALQSDYELKNSELMRLKDAVKNSEDAARLDLMKKLVEGINEQFYYLTMFYLELKETGKLEPESIELFGDTLNNIDMVLADLGIEKIGNIDNQTIYDSSIHMSSDAKLSNGEKVVVSGYGWKIGNEVYIKAPVEKGEQ